MIAVPLIAALYACTAGSGDGPALTPEEARGKAVYAANCTACHNLDPARPGGIGPEVKGSSRELLEARLLRGEYPAGYTPKRTSTLMTPLPALEPDIAALAAYLR